MSLPEKSFEPDAACPLDGVRVVDMSRLVAGNAVSSQLADFGAEVLKIEDPGRGDPLRAWQSQGVSVHWKLYARNKKSVALGLRDPRGRDLLLDLAASSEVLIENFRPGTLENIGLGPDTLHARNPRLVIVRVSGWGQDGPYRDRPGFGTLVESMSGYAARTGFADREPVLPPTALADMVAGLYGAFAVMVALRRVEVEGGGGQIIDLPLLDPLFSFIATWNAGGPWIAIVLHLLLGLRGARSATGEVTLVATVGREATQNSLDARAPATSGPRSIDSRRRVPIEALDSRETRLAAGRGWG
jgi:crotonobetainyl-CoA:carnitine CoA-transferase CaiB-like acyl-CoA transferase